MVIPGILLYKLFALCFSWATNVEYEEEKGGKKDKKKEKVLKLFIIYLRQNDIDLIDNEECKLIKH